MKSIIIIVLFFFLPSVYSFNCLYFEDEQLQKDCKVLKNHNESLVGGLIYEASFIPDHNKVREYNKDLVFNISKIPKTNQDIIKDAWFTILTIEPQVIYLEKRYVPNNIDIRIDYDYKVQVPRNFYSSNKNDGKVCKKLYSLNSNKVSLKSYLNNNLISNKKEFSTNIEENSELFSNLNINVKVNEKIFTWDKYCCKRSKNGCSKYCYDCDFDRTNIITETLNLENSKQLTLYENKLDSEFEIIDQYYNTSKGKIKLTNNNLFLTTNYSELTSTQFTYVGVLENPPFNILTLKVKEEQTNKIKNIIKNNDTLYLTTSDNCQIKESNFFETKTQDCQLNLSQQTLMQTKNETFGKSIYGLIFFIIFVFVNVFFYKSIKFVIKKIFPFLLILLMLTPTVFAQEEDSCGFTNFSTCLPKAFFSYLIELLNEPLEPLLNSIKSFLEDPPNLEPMKVLWAIIIYAISFFYGLLFMLTGFMFLTSGHSPIKREEAKEWFTSTFLLIIFVQASYFIYELLLELGTSMTSGILSLINPNFFKITADTLSSAGLEIMMYGVYAVVLLLTLLLFAMRYLMVIFGLVFFPLGLFFYFIPPIRSYGVLIIKTLGVMIFFPFIAAITLLATSLVVNVGIFSELKILLMISAFLIVDILFFVTIWHTIIKSAVPRGSASVAFKFITKVI